MDVDLSALRSAGDELKSVGDDLKEDVDTAESAVDDVSGDNKGFGAVESISTLGSNWFPHLKGMGTDLFEIGEGLRTSADDIEESDESNSTTVSTSGSYLPY